MDDRIVRARIEAIQARAVVSTGVLDRWQYRTAIHVGPDEYRYDEDWKETRLPGSWQAGATLFLRCRAELPPAAKGSRMTLRFDVRNLEGLLSIDGTPYAGIDTEHPRIGLSVSGPHQLEAEFLCVPSAFHTAAARRETALLKEARWEATHPETEALAWDARFAWEAARVAPDARRRGLLSAALEKALLAVDLTAEEAAFRSAVSAARRLLGDLVGAIAPDPEGGRVFLTGHSHIDTAWLWPLRETIRKCGRTFSTACRLLERHPNYHFTCSQPQLYAYTRTHFPALYEEIKRWVAAGRWECTGGMWVEADCNVPSGESLVRQILHGVAFFKREFGVRPTSCWLPDVFGYPASLPGILAGCGLPNFYTNKLHWQARNPFPAHLFHWEGIDGSRVLAHVPRLLAYYNGFPNPEQLSAAWTGFNEKTVYPEVMVPFGFGDGGGGPTEAMLEFADRARSFPGLPAARQGLEERYFADVRAAAPELPAWVGELYLETHRGTYTTQSAIKRANRKNELLLREAELFESIAQIEESHPGAPGSSGASSASRVSIGPSHHQTGEAFERLHAAWENLLLLQFHDILPGSSIGEVYQEAAVDHARISETASEIHSNALARIATAASGSLIAFNSLSWARSDPAEAEVDHAGPEIDLAGPDGKVLPAQVVGRAGAKARIVFMPAALPSLGYASYAVRPGKRQTGLIRVQGLTIESDLYILSLDHSGCIARLHDKRFHREVVSPDRPANLLQLFQDGPEVEAAWNIHPEYERRQYAWDSPVQIDVVEQGPLRAVVRIGRRYRQSRLEQDVVVWAGFPRIDFVTRAHWRERQILLRAAFPVEVRSQRASFEIQFGAVERPTHRNTSWEQEKFEVCAHRWMDLSEHGYGVSVLNDCRYGCDVHAGALRLTLLRGPEWPDPEADVGEHLLTYSLLPHGGGWAEAETVLRAWELNAPIVCLPGRTGSSPSEAAAAHRSFLSVEGPAILETLKPAEDRDGWILRLYEPNGGRGLVTIHTQRAIASAAACNHLEEETGHLEAEGSALRFQIQPFQVRSFRIRF